MFASNKLLSLIFPKKITYAFKNSNYLKNIKSFSTEKLMLGKWRG